MDLGSYGVDPVAAAAEKKRRQNHGRKLFAMRLAQRGEIERSKEYCANNGLGWPPFPWMEVPQIDPVSAVEDPLERERLLLAQKRAAVERQRANPRAHKGGRPPKLDRDGNRIRPKPEHAQKVPSVLEDIERRERELTVAALARVAAEPAAMEVQVADSAPEVEDLSTAAVAAPEPPEPFSNLRQAEIVMACRNPRLFAIQFKDGAQEEASLWRERGRKVGTVVNVRLESGIVGANPVYEEVFG